MTYDVQRYCLCWICEAMVKWNEPCHEERVTNASYGEWVIAADAEAHEKAAVEAAYQRALDDKTAWAADPLGYDTGLRDGREQAVRDCIAAVEHLHDHEAPHDAHRNALWNAITALRALLERETS